MHVNCIFYALSIYWKEGINFCTSGNLYQLIKIITRKSNNGNRPLWSCCACQNQDILYFIISFFQNGARREFTNFNCIIGWWKWGRVIWHIVFGQLHSLKFVFVGLTIFHNVFLPLCNNMFTFTKIPNILISCRAGVSGSFG